MGRLQDLIMNNRAAVLGSASVLLMGGVAWALSTQPLVPRADPAGSSGSSPAAMAMGPAAGSAQAPDDGPAGEGDGERTGEAQAGGDEPGSAEGDAANSDAGAPAEGDPGSEPSSGGGEQGQRPAGGPSTQGPSKPGGGSPSGQTPSKPAEKPAAPQKPQHSHSFQPVYRDEPVYAQQWVSNWVDVYKGRQERYICGCGAVFLDWGSCTAHRAALAEQGNPCGRVIDDSYDIWEKEDHGSYQQVQTGTTQVLDHYRCPCGAVK